MLRTTWDEGRLSSFSACYLVSALSFKVSRRPFPRHPPSRLIPLTTLVTSSDSWVQIMMGRFISGWGVGGCSAAGTHLPLVAFSRSLTRWAIVPVYQSETVPKQLRGTLIATYQLMITAGILVAYCISIGTRELGNSGSWRIVIALGIFFAIVLGVGIMFVSL